MIQRRQLLPPNDYWWQLRNTTRLCAPTSEAADGNSTTLPQFVMRGLVVGLSSPFS